MVKRITVVLVTISLVFSLIGLGFFACAAQPTTRILSSITSDFDTSPYTRESLTSLAVATRDFTVDPYFQGRDVATQRLAANIVAQGVVSSAPGSAKATRWDGMRTELLKESDMVTIMYSLAARSESYGLSPDAISHLVDCNTLINTAVPLVLIAMGVTVIGLIVLYRDKRLRGLALMAGPALLFAFMVGCGIWAAIDFRGFFSVFHAVLFPQGNWMFSSDSLLICMLPEGFWMGMGITWLAVTVIAAIICVARGNHLRKIA